jgi:hypothetical protein
MFSANSSQVSEDRLYVEDVFSTYLFAANNSTQTITNNIDLAGRGGMVWLKSRTNATAGPIYDTARGTGKLIYPSTTLAEENLGAGGVYSFNSNGFSIGSDDNANYGSGNSASWTFRKASKFFDVVTYTGNGTVVRQINHSLGVTPGFIVVKRTDSTGNWMCIHRNNPMGELVLNSSAANTGNTDNIEVWTSTYIGVSNAANTNGATYVAYLFAHDTTSDGIIQCGSFTTDSGGNFSVSLGWEPQWVMAKRTDATQNWFTADTMRGFSQTQFNTINPNLSAAEAANASNYIAPNATGFGSIGNQFLSGSATYIYIAIRRGPMRTPTSGTSVFSPQYPISGSIPVTITTGFPVDLGLVRNTTVADSMYFYDRLRGSSTSSIKYLKSDSTAAEATGSGFGFGLDNNTGTVSTWYGGAAYPTINYNFRRAPSFFDEVCYTGTGSARTVNHNLGVAPELIIIKSRSNATEWIVGTQFGDTNFKYLNLNTTASSASGENYPFDFSSKPTATSFGLTSESRVNGSGRTFVSYLFASCPGVSKVGNYTGNGSSQTINCGFAAGARFVMIKRTDSTGNWLVADSARGIVAGNDPLLYLNSTAVEVTSLDWIDADSSGFVVNQDSTANANVNGATYIYLAIS